MWEMGVALQRECICIEFQNVIARMRNNMTVIQRNLTREKGPFEEGPAWGILVSWLSSLSYS